MIFPKTIEEYWQLSRDERLMLFQKYGFGWRTITEGVWYNHQKPDEKTSEKPDEKAGEKTEQIVLDFAKEKTAVTTETPTFIQLASPEKTSQKKPTKKDDKNDQ